MLLRYLDGDGAERAIDDVAAFHEALRNRVILRDTLVFDSITGTWGPAGSDPLVRRLVAEGRTRAAGAQGPPISPPPPPPIFPPPPPARGPSAAPPESPPKAPSRPSTKHTIVLQGPSPSEVAPGPVWARVLRYLAILAAILVSVPAAVAVHRDPWEGLGYGAGQTAVLLLLAFLISQLIPPFHRWIGWTIGAGLALLLAIGEYGMAARAQVDVLRFFSARQNQDRPAAATSSGQALAGTIKEIAFSHQEAVQTVMLRLNDAFATVGDTAFAHLLSTPAGRSDLRNRLGEVRKAIVGTKASLDSLTRATSARLETLESAHPAMGGISAGLQRASSQDQAFVAGLLSNQDSAALTMDSLVVFIGAHGAKMGPEGPLFRQDQEVEDYNRLFGNLEGLRRQEDSIQQVLAASRTSHAAQLDSVLAALGDSGSTPGQKPVTSRNR